MAVGAYFKSASANSTKVKNKEMFWVFKTLETLGELESAIFGVKDRFPNQLEDSAINIGVTALLLGLLFHSYR